ncbi:hypothetical protein NDU88_004582 [Pleurodeles waltl]|uniref:Uncharacterized protein n=1 Tax=Pleurodeles waltl TaxID=8319 RepID=A0AAV7VJ75_PLEWA|nr:hypothetical protein NDU88_004582 [Pleurodeles waltl]
MGGHPTREQEDGGGSAGDASQRRRGASRQLTPLMSRILAVAYPDLDGRVRTSQQTQGGGGEVASEHEGAASHMAMAGHATDSDFASETEGEGSSTAGTRADVSDSDSSSEGSSLVVAATSVPPATTGHPVQLGAKARPAHHRKSILRLPVPGASDQRPQVPKSLHWHRQEVRCHLAHRQRWERATSVQGRVGRAARPTSPAAGQLARRAPPAPSQVFRRTHTGPVLQPRRAPPATAQLPRRAPPATAQLGNEGPPATAQLGNEGPPTQAPLNMARTAKASTAEQGKDRQGKHRLTGQGPPRQAPLIRARTAKSSTAEQGKDG